MYIDFDPKQIAGEAMDKVDKAVSQVGPRDPLDCWGTGEDGGSVVTQANIDIAGGEAGEQGTVSDPGVLMYAEAGREDVTPM
jgi:hypothetical protein